MYARSITRTHRTAFVVAIDGSGSMAEPIRFRGRSASKAEAVAEVADELLFELIERARRDDGVRDYYDIALVGYGGDDRIESLLPGGAEMLSVAELAARQPVLRRRSEELRLPDGRIALRETTFPQWVAPRAAGQTPMCEALRRCRDLADAWCARPENAASFPPVVFNITDGEATDCDDEELRAVAAQIRSLGTADGNVLLINIHLAADEEGRTLFFPGADEPLGGNRYAQLLYDCSSQMPAPFDEAIRREKGPGALPPFRGMSFNASATQLLTMLNIGSISIKTE